jgi:N-methylhydantoinase A
MLAADLEHIGLRTLTRYLDELRPADLGAAKLELGDEVAARLAADGFGQDRVTFGWEADLRHEGQASELTIHFDGDDPDALRRRFIEEYEKTYGYRDDSPIELVKLRVVGRGLSAQRLNFKQLRIAAPAAAAAAAHRHVHFVRNSAATITEVVSRAALASRPRRGPLIVEEFDATIVVPPDATAHLDAIGNIVLELS